MQLGKHRRPRIGVPWRSIKDQTNERRKYYDDYLNAIREAGGEPVEILLTLDPKKLARTAKSLDAVVLPGSPADVNPELYKSARQGETNDPDPKREATDFSLLKDAFATGKPVLAICYGAQLLNVHLHGSLVQDIPNCVGTGVTHERIKGNPETFHAIKIEGGQLAELAGNATARVNSSHHQSILKPGRGLRVAARAMDGVIEAIEWTGGPGWVLGVQWHPERMSGDALADALFRRLVTEAQRAAKAGTR